MNSDVGYFLLAMIGLGLAPAACLEVRDDGAVEDEGCDLCHADLGGAHAVHASNDVAAPTECADCHPVPESWFSDGHMDAVVDVLFPPDGLASADGATPAWDGAVCSGVYCHGATIAGAAYPVPRWTDQFEDGLACNACHGNPPPPPHTSGHECHECHESAYGGSGKMNPSVHLNGKVNAEDDDDDEGEDDDGVGP